MATPKVLAPEIGFLGLEAENIAGADKPKTAIIPFGLEATVSYGGGTAKGPAAMIAASHQVELFDEEHWRQPVEAFRLETWEEPGIPKKTEDALDLLAAKQHRERVLAARVAIVPLGLTLVGTAGDGEVHTPGPTRHSLAQRRALGGQLGQHGRERKAEDLDGGGQQNQHGEDPVAALRRVWLAYAPQMQDYVARAFDAASAPRYGVPGDQCLADNPRLPRGEARGDALFDLAHFGLEAIGDGVFQILPCGL